MRFQTKTPFSDLPTPDLSILNSHETIKRVEIGVMFGVHPSLITKDCHWLNQLKGKIHNFDGIDYYHSIPRTSLWLIYAMEMFRRFHILHGETPRRSQFVKQVLSKGEVAIDFYVEAGGGSREHLEKLVEDYLAKKKVTKLSDTVIEVQAS